MQIDYWRQVQIDHHWEGEFANISCQVLFHDLDDLFYFINRIKFLDWIFHASTSFFCFVKIDDLGTLLSRVIENDETIYSCSFGFLNVFECCVGNLWQHLKTFKNVSIWNCNVPDSETFFHRFWTFWVLDLVCIWWWQSIWVVFPLKIFVPHWYTRHWYTIPDYGI